jgi:hypothetical protein
MDEAAERMAADESKASACSLCGTALPSKTALFKHLEAVHGYENPHAKPCKAAVLVGWLSDVTTDRDEWVRDLSQGTSEENWEGMLKLSNPTRARVETHVFAALYTLENPGLTMAEALALPINTIRPKSFTRASCHARSSDPEGIEASTSGLADLFCILLKRAPGPGGRGTMRVQATTHALYDAVDLPVFSVVQLRGEVHLRARVCCRHQ